MYIVLLAYPNPPLLNANPVYADRSNTYYVHVILGRSAPGGGYILAVAKPNADSAVQIRTWTESQMLKLCSRPSSLLPCCSCPGITRPVMGRTAEKGTRMLEIV